MDRVRAALTAVTDEIMLVANDRGAAEWLPDVALRADAFPGAGGLAGVHAALGAGHDVVVVAWDMPFVTAPLLRLIRDEGTASNADACVPESHSPHGIEPFCAWYSSALLPALDAFLAGGGGPARAFLDTVSVRRIPLSAVRAVGDPARMFFSVNTLTDLERARALPAQ